MNKKQIIKEFLSLRKPAWNTARVIDRLYDEWDKLQSIIDLYEQNHSSYTELKSKIALSSWERILEIRTTLDGEVKKGCKHKRTGKGLKYENYKQFDKVQSFQSEITHYKVLREYKVWENGDSRLK